jgi:hypothetical protein
LKPHFSQTNCTSRLDQISVRFCWGVSENRPPCS